MNKRIAVFGALISISLLILLLSAASVSAKTYVIEHDDEIDDVKLLKERAAGRNLEENTEAIQQLAEELAEYNQRADEYDRWRRDGIFSPYGKYRYNSYGYYDWHDYACDDDYCDCCDDYDCDDRCDEEEDWEEWQDGYCEEKWDDCVDEFGAEWCRRHLEDCDYYNGCDDGWDDDCNDDGSCCNYDDCDDGCHNYYPKYAPPKADPEYIAKYVPEESKTESYPAYEPKQPGMINIPAYVPEFSKPKVDSYPKYRPEQKKSKTEKFPVYDG